MQFKSKQQTYYIKKATEKKSKLRDIAVEALLKNREKYGRCERINLEIRRENI